MHSAEKHLYLLTIYILSYEAPENLARILDSLLPFQGSQTQIIVGDNSEIANVAPIIQERQNLFNGQLSRVKHVCNLGALGNILRAFELAQSRYLWIVGCGDAFCPDALSVVEDILSQASESDSAALHIFPVNEVKIEPWPAKRMVFNDFATALKELEFGPLTNINSVIYDVVQARRFLPTAYQASSSLVPHTAIIAALLGSQKNEDAQQMVFHPTPVFQRLQRSYSWNPHELWTNISNVYPSLDNAGDWKKIRREILRTHSSWILGVTQLLSLPVSSYFIERTFGQFGWLSLPLLSKLLILDWKRRSKTYRFTQSTIGKLRRVAGGIRRRLRL